MADGDGWIVIAFLSFILAIFALASACAFYVLGFVSNVHGDDRIIASVFAGKAVAIALLLLVCVLGARSR